MMSRIDEEKNWKGWICVCREHRNGGESQRLSHLRSRQQAKENPRDIDSVREGPFFPLKLGSGEV